MAPGSGRSRRAFSFLYWTSQSLYRFFTSHNYNTHTSQRFFGYTGSNPLVHSLTVPDMVTTTAPTLPTRLPATTEGTPMAQPRILIVEDERGLIQSLSWYFKREGYEVTVAEDGQEGLRKRKPRCPMLCCST